MNAGAAGRAGFIGAGRMGEGMAGCLIRAGRPLALLAHRNRAPLEALLAMGATEAATATELAADADVIYTCVSNAEVVELLGTELLPALRPGQVWIDATTSLPETSKRIAQLVAKTGAVFADAPITGGPPQAARGELASLVGCEEEHLPVVVHAVAPYSRITRRFGPPGAGHAAKLLNNLVSQGTMILLADAFRTAAELEVDWRALHDVMKAGAARSGTLEKAVVPALDGDFGGSQFTIANAAKDLDYAVRLIGSAAPGRRAVAAALNERLSELVECGYGNEFVSRMLDPSEPGPGAPTASARDRSVATNE